MKLKDALINDYETQHDAYPDGEYGSHRVLELSKDYRLHLTVHPTKPDGYYHIKVQSQWLGAKDPDGLQTRFQVTLTKRQALELTETILEGTR